METPECWWCGVQEQTVIHLYTECWRWRREQRKLSRLTRHQVAASTGRRRDGLATDWHTKQVVGPILPVFENYRGGQQGQNKGEGALNLAEEAINQEGTNHLTDLF